MKAKPPKRERLRSAAFNSPGTDNTLLITMDGAGLGFGEESYGISYSEGVGYGYPDTYGWGIGDSLGHVEVIREEEG